MKITFTKFKKKNEFFEDGKEADVLVDGKDVGEIDYSMKKSGHEFSGYGDWSIDYYRVHLWPQGTIEPSVTKNFYVDKKGETHLAKRAAKKWIREIMEAVK